jgi:flagellar hook-associated protein FlgK
MVYKEKVLGLLETLEARLKLIENVANGAIRMDAKDINDLIQQTKKLRDQIYEIISIERN